MSSTPHSRADAAVLAPAPPTMDPRAETRLQALVADLTEFVSKGAGFWRGAGLDLKELSTLPIVADRESSENGPDAHNQAIEQVLDEAISTLEKPTRDAARHLFGLSDAGRTQKGKIARGDLAAKTLYTNGRSFRRTGSKGEKSKLDQLIEAVAGSLLTLGSQDAPTGGDSRPRLLYVEDTPAWATIVREALPDYDVACANTLRKAMEALVNEGPFALVLVDPNLTDLDEGAGLEVLEYLRDRMPNTPRVVVTGSPLPGAMTRTLGERYGVSEILIKGDYTLPDLRSTIEREVGKVPASDNGEEQQRTEGR